jgi:pimeloyl-ACP methyl ester carboxylesterase
MSILVELPLELYNRNAFADFKPVADFDLGTARAMAWMSQLAYECAHPDKIAKICEAWGLRRPRIIASALATRLPLLLTRGIIAEGHGATILAFAGTDPMVPANWFTDFDVKVTPDNVHRGFESAAAAVRDQVRDALAGRSERTLLLAGHSLGAALAAVTADRALLDLSLRADAVYGFGMPRGGGQEFARRYNDTLGATTYRLMHGEDIVASVPPSRLGFRHVGRLMRCARAGHFAGAPLAECTDDPTFASSLIAGLRQGLLDFFAGRLQPTYRDDTLGRLSGFLAPPIGDHLPDRYCHACDAPA